MAPKPTRKREPLPEISAETNLTRLVQELILEGRERETIAARTRRLEWIFVILGFVLAALGFWAQRQSTDAAIASLQDSKAEIKRRQLPPELKNAVRECHAKLTGYKDGKTGFEMLMTKYLALAGQEKFDHKVTTSDSILPSLDFPLGNDYEGGGGYMSAKGIMRGEENGDVDDFEQTYAESESIHLYFKLGCSVLEGGKWTLKSMPPVDSYKPGQHYEIVRLETQILHARELNNYWHEIEDADLKVPADRARLREIFSRLTFTSFPIRWRLTPPPPEGKNFRGGWTRTEEIPEEAFKLAEDLNVFYNGRFAPKIR